MAFSTPSLIDTTSNQGWFGPSAEPVMLLTRNAVTGRLYTAYVDDSNNNIINIAHSDDEGTSWTANSTISLSSMTGGRRMGITSDQNGNVIVWSANSSSSTVYSWIGASADTITWYARDLNTGNYEVDPAAYYYASTDRTYVYWLLHDTGNRDVYAQVRYFDWGTNTWTAGTLSSLLFFNELPASRMLLEGLDNANPLVPSAGSGALHDTGYIVVGDTGDGWEIERITFSGTSVTAGTSYTSTTGIFVDTSDDNYCYDIDNGLIWRSGLLFATNTLGLESFDTSANTFSGNVYAASGGGVLSNSRTFPVVIGTKILVLYVESTGSDLAYDIYDPATDTWAGAVVLGGIVQPGISSEFTIEPYVVGSKIVATFLTAGNDYYSVEVYELAQVPTWVTPEDGVSADVERALTLDWSFNDPESGAQSAYRLRRVVDATTTEYWNGTDWQASEDASTKISSSVSSHDLLAVWGNPGTQTSHVYSVQTWNSSDLSAGYSDGLTVFPFSNASTSKGYALPKPYKKQENLLGTLKSNNDYTLSWVNHYVPSYGDLTDDLHIKAGLRPSATSTMRSMFPPVVGGFSVGDGTNYFQDLGATNVYRTNELALSSEKHKEFYESVLDDALGLVLAVPIESYGYLEDSRNGDSEFRYGIVLEDLKHTITMLGVNHRDSAFIIRGAGGEEYLNVEQLVFVLWQAVQELYDIADPSGRQRISKLRRNANRVRNVFKRKKTKNN